MLSYFLNFRLKELAFFYILIPLLFILYICNRVAQLYTNSIINAFSIHMGIENKKYEVDYSTFPSDELLEYIAWKEEYEEDAQRAFIEFCSRFERKVLEKAEIYCLKFGFNSVIALDIANCTFARVWKYYSFKKEKAKSRDINKAIELWLYPIAYNEMIKYYESQRCAEPDPEDLSIIEDIDNLIRFSAGDGIEVKKDIKIMSEILEKALGGLSESHRIIFLTYKAYEIKGHKNIPRAVSKMLRERFNLVQSSVGVYKKVATDQVKNYIKSLNGN